MSDIAERLTDVVASHLSVEPGIVVSGASFIDDLGADSLDMVDLIMAFEETFDIEIPMDVSEKLDTVGQTISYVTLLSVNGEASPVTRLLEGRLA